MEQNWDEVRQKVEEGKSEFKAALHAGNQYELWIALKFLGAGLGVITGKLDDSGSPWDPRFREEKDVVILPRWHIIEVKTSTYAWTGPEDIPVHWGGLDICTVKRWNKRIQKPLAFVLMSQPTLAHYVVWSRTKDEWTIKESHDSRRGGWVSETFVAPLHLLRPFDELVDWLLRDRERNQWTS